MDLQSITFLGETQSLATTQRVIETTGIEIAEETLSVAPANMNGAVAPTAECAGPQLKTIPFAATLRHIA